MKWRVPSWFLVLLVVGNSIGVIFGFTYWYGAQLLASPLYLWPLIPVSPLYALLFLVSLVLIRRKMQAPFFFFLTSVGLVKYGIWTVFFWLTAHETGFGGLMISWLVGSHVVMAAEALVLVPAVRQKWWYIPGAMGWFLLNDYAHYGEDLVTKKVVMTSFSFAMSIALVLTVLVPIVVWFLAKRRIGLKVKGG